MICEVSQFNFPRLKKVFVRMGFPESEFTNPDDKNP